MQYKTYKEQIEIVKNRGLIFGDEENAERILAVHNYYNIVNGYKELFLVNKGKYEHFYNGTTFEELYLMYNFDDRLRDLILDYSLQIEKLLRSQIAHIFAKNHQTDLDMLNKTNYNTAFSTPKFDTDSVITELGNCLKDQKNKNNKMILHFTKDGKKIVPPWVFVNILSFGTLSKLFSILTKTDQKEICDNLSFILSNDISIKDLNNFLPTLSFVRNECAHSHRFYDFRYFVQVSQNNKVYKDLGLTKQPLGVFSILIIFKNLLDKDTFDKFWKEFLDVVDMLQDLKIIDKNIVYKKMGLIGNWKDLGKS